MYRQALAIWAGCFGGFPAASAGQTATLPLGTEIKLETATPLSSKTSVKGDLIALKTIEDVSAGGHRLIPAGTDVVGQVSDARAKGAMGMSGKLAIRPLYIRMGDVTVRLGGAASEKASAEAGAIVGMVILTPGFTGRSAAIPQGAKLSGYVARSIALPTIDAGK